MQERPILLAPDINYTGNHLWQFFCVDILRYAGPVLLILACVLFFLYRRTGNARLKWCAFGLVGIEIIIVLAGTIALVTMV